MTKPEDNAQIVTAEHDEIQFFRIREVFYDRWAGLNPVGRKRLIRAADIRVSRYMSPATSNAVQAVVVMIPGPGEWPD